MMKFKQTHQPALKDRCHMMRRVQGWGFIGIQGNSLIKIVYLCYIVLFFNLNVERLRVPLKRHILLYFESEDLDHLKMIQLSQHSKMQIKEETPSELYLHTLNSNLKYQSMNIHLGDVRGVSISRPLEVSAFHLIVWVFAVKDDLEKEQHRRVKAMYGNCHDMIDPVTPSLEAFSKVMQSIKTKNKRCVVKVVVDSKLKKKILDTVKNDDQIIQVYHYRPTKFIEKLQIIDQANTRSEFGTGLGSTQPFGTLAQKDEQINRKAVRSDVLLRNRKLVGVFDDFNQIIERAERQVETFTKSFRTFENSHCLIGDFDKITRYRLRLIACIRLKASDFVQTLKAFKQFVFKTIPWLNAHLESMGQNGISSFSIINSIQRYQAAAQSFLQAEKKFIEQKDATKIDKERFQADIQGLDSFEALKDQFFHEMISIYQYEGLFYYLLNNHLKLIGQRGVSWKQFALPFSHMHRAIKHLYIEGLKNEPQFYNQPFTVFRGGRARKSEFQRYADAVANGGAFIEFFGFLSTSLSAKIVADKFVFSRYSRDSGADAEDADEQLVFLIKVNPCSAILAEKYGYLVNGFFKLTSMQLYGESEREVLFNAMNVFRLTGISKRPISQLFTEVERQQATEKQDVAKNLPTFKYNEEKTRNRFYKKEITVVELQYGSFYEALLTQNKYDLSPAERVAKENYVYCMNRVNRFEKFDFGDACELTNELQESYMYLKSKVGVTQQDLYLSSKVDNKNYFSRLSTVCHKMGKAKQAIGYSQIAIKCYRQLEQVHHNEVFNAHYERLVNMQTRCIEILQENSDFSSAEKQLREQLLEIRRKSNPDPKVKLLESKVYINQAINYYSMGRLEECINRFAKCQRQLTKTIQQFSFENEPLPCLFTDFLAQIVCPNPYFGHRFCYYGAYVDALQERNRKEREKQLIQKHGSREQLQHTSKLAKDLQVIAKQAVQSRNTLFKSRKKYEEFIARFSHQFQFSTNQSINCHQKNQRDEIQEKIIDKRRKLSSLDHKSNQYSQVFTEYNQLIKKRSDIEYNILLTQSSQSSHAIQQQDKKFKTRQRQRKIRELRNSILTENRHRLIEEYLRCTAQIEQAISQLKSEGYVESSLSILKMRVEKSKIYQQCDERTAAMNEIQQIIRSGMVEGEYRYRELALAYSTKGKIHLEMKQIELAIDSIDQALQCFYKTVPSLREEHLDDAVSEITQSPQRVVPKQFNQLQHNNDYLQTRILKLKALLMWVQIKRPRENGISRYIFGRQSSNHTWQQKHSNDHLLFVQFQISEIRNILRARGSLEDMDQLDSDLLQVQICFHLISHRAEQRLGRSFQCLKEYLHLRSHQQGKQNTKSALFCCELICRNSQNNDFLVKFIRSGHQDWLKSVQYNIQNGPFAWKVQKSYFFLQRAGGRENAARLHLEKAIQILEVQLFNKHDSSLQEELSSLKWKLNERPAIILTKQGNLDQMNDLQQPIQSTLISGLKYRHQSNYSRYQSRREKANSTRISNASTIGSLNDQLISIKPKQHQNPELLPQLSQLYLSSLTLRQFCRNIGEGRQPRRKREASYMNSE